MNPLSTSAAMSIRPVRPEDTDLMQRFLQGLDSESRSHRFHGAVKVCSSGLLRLLTCADGQRHVAWVVVGTDPSGPRLLGEARFFCNASGDEAELALTVADDCRGQGIAKRLMQTLVAAANARGVLRLRAEVELCNPRMRAFVQRHGFSQVQDPTEQAAHVTSWVRPLTRPRARWLR